MNDNKTHKKARLGRVDSAVNDLESAIIATRTHKPRKLTTKLKRNQQDCLDEAN